MSDDPAEAAPANDPRLARAQRAWLVALQVALVLPFAVTKSCGNGDVEAFTGLGYYVSAERWAFLVALVLVVGPLLAVPWTGGRTDRAVTGLGLRAWLATLGALLAIFGPFLAFLFDDPQPRVGWWVHGVGWSLTALGYLGLTGALLVRGVPGEPTGAVSGGGPEWGGVVALLVAPLVAVALKMALEPDVVLANVLAAGAAGVAVVVPLVLAGAALVRGLRTGEAMGPTRPLWWGATGVTLLVHLAAGLAK